MCARTNTNSGPLKNYQHCYPSNYGMTQWQWHSIMEESTSPTLAMMPTPLFTPLFRSSLLSISSLDNTGFISTFGHGRCQISSTSLPSITISGHLVNNLYVIEPVATAVPAAIATPSKKRKKRGEPPTIKRQLSPSEIKMWHCRLAHANPTVLQKSRARRADAAVQKMVGKYGIPSASARNLQQALIHGTLLYAAELSWMGTKKEERDVQVLTNRMGRASLGARRTTPVGIVTAESALPPARALLDHRQASFALRLLSRPVGSGGQEEILVHRSSELTARIRRRCGLRRGETAELQRWEEFREMRAEVHVERKEEALETAKKWSEEDQNDTVWTDGSRLENGSVGAAVAFKEGGNWKEEGTFLGGNKEVFDAEIFAIGRALEIINERSERGKRYTIFSDSQAAISRAQHDRVGAGQTLAINAINTAGAIADRGNILTFRWTPSHSGIVGNERADKAAKRAAEGKEGRASSGYLLEASLSHLTRVTTETRANATAEWIRTHCGRRRRYNPPKGGKMRKDLAKAPKELAGRFYQMLSGHAATAEHLKRVGQTDSDTCFWCGSGERQTRHHLFVKCRRWMPEIRRLWQKARAGTGEGGAPSIRKLFGNEKNTKAILEFLEKTKVGKMPGRVLLAGGPDLEEEELEGFSLRVSGGEAETEVSSSGDEDGPGPPV